LKILVADDDTDIANLHKLILQSKGHTVETAHDGQKCLEMYGKTKGAFDAVVLDHKMPALDGIQVAKRILGLNPQQRIIIATGQLKETLHDCMKELGRIVEIIEKPFEPELLINVLEDQSESQKK
jgi:CheY-like chemotaxis protein